MTTRQPTTSTARCRERWADNLRVALIAGVVVAHTATAYVVDIPWYYDDEKSTAGVWGIVVGFPTFTAGAFGLGPLFVVAGWFAAASLARQGPGAFAAARLRRLGLPLIAFVLLLQPLTDYIGNLRSERGSFLFYFGHTEVSVMWFVAALLTFSLAYAALRARRPAAGARRPVSPAVAVLAAGLAVAAGSLLVWPVWPWNADVVLNLRVGEWPQAAALFAIGVHAGEHGWLDTISRSAQRRLGAAAAAGIAAFGALFGAELAWGDVNELLYATSALPTVALALLDGLIAVSWSLWCVSWFRRRWTGHGRVLDRAARASYATYIIHPLVLTAMMVAFAVVPLPPVTKFLVVSAAGVPACFAVGYALTRIPGTAAAVRLRRGSSAVRTGRTPAEPAGRSGR